MCFVKKAAVDEAVAFFVCWAWSFSSRVRVSIHAELIGSVSDWPLLLS